MVDYYKILGIPNDATKQDIDAAWRRAVKEWHPDRNRSEEANARLKAINVARQILTNDAARRKYDRANGFTKPDNGREKMERPVKTRSNEPDRPNPQRSHRQPGFATRKGKKKPRFEAEKQQNDGNEWWNRFADVARRNAEAVKNEAARAAAERNRENVTSILDRRPRLTRYVLIPAGFMAILIAALVTIILV